jgi:hypothetical protein
MHNRLRLVCRQAPSNWLLGRPENNEPIIKGVSMKNNYWFPAKKYGYGWGMPCHIYGWIVFVIFIAWFSLSLIYLNPRSHPMGCGISLIGSILFLYSFLKANGEPARWRWGDDVKNKSAQQSDASETMA